MTQFTAKPVIRHFGIQNETGEWFVGFDRQSRPVWSKDNRKAACWSNIWAAEAQADLLRRFPEGAGME